MKCMHRILCLLLACLMLTACNTTAPDSSGAALDTQQKVDQIKQLGESPDDNYRTYYEVFVYSFCDSDGDGIGDIPGLVSKLDYLQNLGIRGLWLMPIHPSSSYHKYNVEDYYAIDPAYGTMEDFETLIAECEKRDIHVIIDLVLNHTASEHPWFKEAVSYLQNLPAGAEPNVEECKYLDYYFFSREAGAGARPVEGTEWFYEGMFDFTMPDVNFASEELWEEYRQIMEFWIGKGVAGFRLDAAKEFYSGNAAKNIEVLNRIQQTATAIKPDCYLVAEVWENFGQISEYYKSGITSIFNFAFGNVDGKITNVIRAAGNPGTVATYATALEKADKAYLASNPDYIDAPFLSNHDVGRIAGFANRDPLKIKMAGAMNVLMSGSCFIYYGEELGMPGSGNDPSKRAPMLWNEARDNGTTNPPPECELPAEYPLGSLEIQEKDDLSVYNYYRQAIALRNALPVISHGRTTCETALNIGCVSAQRKTWNEEACIILMNINPEAATADLSAYADWTLAATLSADGNPITLDGTTLNLSAYGIAVLLPAAQ
ncbi:MAG: DUF3459 domain-containing protein [Ruminococcaceae bacterium]|nr:DUF3459 domain-containing protein [Oscillospiraceae bacterium]